jgi:chromate reductase, NAD(P)H dehydrogenase (quinone)
VLCQAAEQRAGSGEVPSGGLHATGLNAGDCPCFFRLEPMPLLCDYRGYRFTQEIVMSQFKIAVVTGSLRKDSFNRKLADALAKLGPADFTFAHAEIGDLPLYNQDHDDAPAAAVTRLKGEIKSASGVLFVTPEYNRSIPGVLKNALDHASRPYGQSAWGGKPAGVIGVSIGAAGTCMAQQHLRNVIAYLDMPTLNGIGEGSKKFLQGWMDKYAAWVRKHAG